MDVMRRTVLGMGLAMIVAGTAQAQDAAKTCIDGLDDAYKTIYFCTLAMLEGKMAGADRAVVPFKRANAYVKTGLYADAVTDYGVAIERDMPNLHQALNNRGIAYRRMGQYELALKDFARSLELNPDSAVAHSNRGHVYLDLGMVDEAVGAADKAIALRPDYAGAYAIRGLARARRGQREDAIADLRRANELFGGVAWIGKTLEELETARGFAKDAVVARRVTVSD
jgi:tetratricopeptide (TPR) repeat protein